MGGVSQTDSLTEFINIVHAARNAAFGTYNAGLKTLDACTNGKSVDPR